MGRDTKSSLTPPRASQVFTRLAGDIKFVGGHDEIETLHESGGFETTFAPFL